MRPAIVKADHEPSHIYFMRDEEGRLVARQAEPTPRANTASSLTAIVEMMGAGSEPVISEAWYSRDGVTLFLDAKTRRDRVTLPVSISPQMKKLIELQSSQPTFSQSAFLKLLRIDLYGCLGSAGNLVEIVRRVKFKATQQAEGAVGHGSVSLGRAITAEVTGTGTIPETVTLDVPVFANACFSNIREAVVCAVEPNAETNTFQLIPLPGEIERAVARGEGEIGEMIGAMTADAGIDCKPLYGKP